MSAATQPTTSRTSKAIQQLQALAIGKGIKLAELDAFIRQFYNCGVGDLTTLQQSDAYNRLLSVHNHECLRCSTKTQCALFGCRRRQVKTCAACINDAERSYYERLFQ